MMEKDELKNYIISYENGTVGHFSEPLTKEKAKEQLLERCENINLQGKLLEHSNYKEVAQCKFGKQNDAGKTTMIIVEPESTLIKKASPKTMKP